VTPDLSGVSEASYNTLNLARLAGALAVPFLLIVYALPLSLVLVAGGRLWQRDADEPEHAPRLRRALLGTIAASLAIMIANGVVNPRYGYVMLPIWCLLAAATASLYHAGRLDPATRLRLRQAATGLVIILPIAQLWLTATLWPGSERQGALILAALLSVTAGGVGTALWVRQAVVPGLAALMLVVLALSVPVADRKIQDRQASSARAAAALLLSHVPPDSRITAAQMLRDKPELFYYAGLPIDARFHVMDDPTLLAGPRWVVFSPAEWQRWSGAIAPRADAVHDLDGKATLVHLPPF
jgi:hypothetical protein